MVLPITLEISLLVACDDFHHSILENGAYVITSFNICKICLMQMKDV